MTQSSKRPYKRRTLIVNQKFQYYFILLLFVLSIVVVCLDALFFQILMRSAVENAEKAGFDPVLISTFMSTTQAFFIKFALLSLLAITGITGACGIFLSNKIAGPVYRALKVIEQLTRKEPIHLPIRLRSMDCFPELETALNQLVEQVQADTAKNQKS